MKLQMNNSTPIGIEAMEGKTYIVGREGHIYVRDSSVSRQHAEIKFIDGRIRLRDLDSTNGTYLVRDNRRVQVLEGYVKPHQPIAMGKWQCTVQSLLENVGIFATYSDDAGLKVALEKRA
jgi:hypothetical protein